MRPWNDDFDSTSCTAIPKDVENPGETNWIEYAFGGATAIVAFTYYSIHTLPHLLSWCRGSSHNTDHSHGDLQRGNYRNVTSEIEMADFENEAQIVVVDAVSIMNHDQIHIPTIPQKDDLSSTVTEKKNTL